MIVPYPSRRQGNDGPPGPFSGLGIQEMIPTQGELFRHHQAMNRFPFHEGWLNGAGDLQTVEQQMAVLAATITAEEKRRTKLQVISTISIATIATLAVLGSVAAMFKALK